MRPSRFKNVYYDRDFGLTLSNLGCKVLPYRANRAYRVGDVLTKALQPRDVLLDLRSVSLLKSRDFDYYDEPASIYDPELLKESIIKYYSGVKEVELVDLDDPISKKALEDLWVAFKPKIQVRPLKDDFASLASGVKLDTSSGYPHYRPKVEQLEYAFNRVQEVVSGRKKPSPCTSFDRTQRIEGDSSHSKVRLIWAYPIEMTMLEGKFLRPLIDYYVDYRVHPIALGWSKLHIGSRMIAVSNSEWQYSIDYSQFDARVPSAFIKKASDFIAKWLSLTGEDFKMWKIVTNYFINTPLLTPWGLIFGKSSGIPSGSYATQIIGSMYNYFLTSYLLRLNGVSPFREKINVLGDDSAFGVPYKLQNLNTLNEKFYCRVNESKSHISSEGKVHFLGRNYDKGIPHVDAKKSRTKFVYPERNRNVDFDGNRLVAASYLMEGVENYGWIHKVLKVYDPGRLVSFSDLRENRTILNDSTILRKYGAWGGHKIDLNVSPSLLAVGLFS